jgi:hypothetical protein
LYNKPEGAPAPGAAKPAATASATPTSGGDKAAPSSPTH